MFHGTPCYLKPSRFQMAAFAQRFNDVTSDITHISELVVYRKYPIERADRLTTRFGERSSSVSETETRPINLNINCSFHSVTQPLSRTNMYRPLTMGWLCGIWCPKAAVRRRMPINFLLSDSFRRTGFPHPPGGADVYSVLWISLSACVYGACVIITPKSA